MDQATRRKRSRFALRRRIIKGTLLGSLGLSAACAVDAIVIEPHWVELAELDLPLADLPEAFIGKRLVHISDLHCSRVVKKDYLLRCVERINELKPDMVVLTGDYITYDGKTDYKQQVVEVIGKLQGTHGVFACLGNHDYGFVTRFHQRGRTELREFLSDQLRGGGVQVLQNQSFPIELDNQRLWMAGTGDLWSQDFAPVRAFGQIPRSETVITLSHNPDTIDLMGDFPVDAMLCGHTHGGQVHLPLVGPPFLPIKNRRYYAGLFQVRDSLLYVNRGLGRLGRVRFNCRPEITVFTLTRRAALAG